MATEPEITIRKLYKCCANGDCSSCKTIAAIRFANILGSTILGTSSSSQAAAVSSLSNHQQSAAAAATITTSQPSTPSSSCSNPNPNPNQSQQTPKKNPNQFNCPNCSFSCSWRYDLKLHLRQKHGIRNKNL